MLEDLYENIIYEVLKRTTEDRRVWKESMRNKCLPQKKNIAYILLSEALQF